MKYLIILALSLAIVGCHSLARFAVCRSQSLGKTNAGSILPVKPGNKWTYRINPVNPDKPNFTVEIGQPDTIYYYDGTRKPIGAYNAIVDGVPSKSSFYVVCDESVATVVIGEMSHEIRSMMIACESPDIEPAYKDRSAWKPYTEIKVIAGTFSGWMREYYFEHINRKTKQKTVSSRYYFSKGVGLVKVENYDDNGNIISSYELESYSIAN